MLKPEIKSNMETQTQTFSQTPTNGPKSSKKFIIIGSVVLGVVVTCVIISFIIGKQQNINESTQTNNLTNTNMPTDLKLQFIEFFKQLRAEAAKNNLEFVKKTIPREQLQVIVKMQNISEDEFVARQARATSKITDQMITGYECNNNICSVTIMWYNDPQDTTKQEFEFSNNAWLSRKDLPNNEQLDVLRGLDNDYQISFYMDGDANFEVSLNGKEIGSYDNPSKQSISKSLIVNKGENNLEIQITPNGKQQITYGWDLYQFPKGAGSEAIFDVEYKLATSAEPGKITPFIKLDIAETKKIEISFSAK
jgi:hypothetical protein